MKTNKKPSAKKPKRNADGGLYTIKGVTLQTDGRTSLWSRERRDVKIMDVELRYLEEDDPKHLYLYGELAVYFTKKSWNVEKHGLIYTDDKFEREVRKAFFAAGMPLSAARDISYSEQGAQGHDYVSFDVGKKFIKAYLGR